MTPDVGISNLVKQGGGGGGVIACYIYCVLR